MQTLAAFVLAFTLVGTEQSYGPYVHSFDGDEHAIAVARSGALLVWSEYAPGRRESQIHLALLNDSARAISPITVLPLTQTGVEALAPAVASDGTSFRVAYFERGRDLRMYTVDVDAAGLPVGTPQRVGDPAPVAYDPRVALEWDGSAYRLLPYSSAAAAGTVIHVSIKPVLVSGPCRGGPFGCFGGWTNAVTWTIGRITRQHVVGKDPVSPLGIAATGDQFAIAWGTRHSVGYLLTGGGNASIWADPEMTAPPGVACDATRCVVAYATARGDVHGIAFPPARPWEQELFAIATSEREEREVQVDVLREDRFLVTYRSMRPADTRIAGRIVQFGHPKQRGVRR